MFVELLTCLSSFKYRHVIKNNMIWGWIQTPLIFLAWSPPCFPDLNLKQLDMLTFEFSFYLDYRKKWNNEHFIFFIDNIPSARISRNLFSYFFVLPEWFHRLNSLSLSKKILTALVLEEWMIHSIFSTIVLVSLIFPKTSVFHEWG